MADRRFSLTAADAKKVDSDSNAGITNCLYHWRYPSKWRMLHVLVKFYLWNKSKARTVAIFLFVVEDRPIRRSALLLSTLHLRSWHRKHPSRVQWLSWHHPAHAPSAIWASLMHRRRGGDRPQRAVLDNPPPIQTSTGLHMHASDHVCGTRATSQFCIWTVAMYDTATLTMEFLCDTVSRHQLLICDM